MGLTENHCATWNPPKFPYPNATQGEKDEWWEEHRKWKKAYNTCATCGSDKIEVRNHSAMWGDGDVYCENNHYVRMWDSG